MPDQRAWCAADFASWFAGSALNFVLTYAKSCIENVCASSAVAVLEVPVSPLKINQFLFNETRYLMKLKKTIKVALFSAVCLIANAATLSVAHAADYSF
jgi:hypothetical protein